MRQRREQSRRHDSICVGSLHVNSPTYRARAGKPRRTTAASSHPNPRQSGRRARALKALPTACRARLGGFPVGLDCRFARSTLDLLIRISKWNYVARAHGRTRRRESSASRKAAMIAFSEASAIHVPLSAGSESRRGRPLARVFATNRPRPPRHRAIVSRGPSVAASCEVVERLHAAWTWLITHREIHGAMAERS
jgi:hypothetical protein